MRICTLGYYEQEGARFSVIRSGLENAGHTIVECHTQQPGFIRKWTDLLRQYRQKGKQCDVLFVPFHGHYIVPLAWALTCLSRKKIIFDVFFSLYDTDVVDRKIVKRWSVRALRSKCIDWLSCKLANIILIDTQHHKEYFVEQYNVPPEKLLVIPIGCKTDCFTPKQIEEADVFTVLFHGSFIPLQGIEVIIRAAKQLESEDIQFALIGKGQTYKEMQLVAQKLGTTNVRFMGQMPMEELGNELAKAHICLGIFGTSQKALRVIPHKVYEILCAARPLITEDSPATQSLLRHEKHALLSKPGDAQSLAEKILLLKENEGLRNTIAQNGRQLFLEKFQPETIVAPLTAWLKKSSSQV